MTTIKFGTDGWRAIIADDYTVENVKRVAEGTALWLKSKNKKQVVIGHDCRFAGQLFAETATRVFGAHGIKVKLAKGFVSTPMVSLGVVKTKSDVGVVITASHNPPSYNGYKLKSNLGGPMIPSEVAEVETCIPAKAPENLPSLEEMASSKLLEYVDLEEMYLEHVAQNFDMKALQNASSIIAYDAMYGAGQRAMKRILPNATTLHCDDDPSFKGQAPEPIHRNLQELSNLLKKSKKLQLGIANDGDADRIGMYDAKGNFVDSHHILLLLLLYMFKYKKQKGKVVFTFSVTDKLRVMAEKFGLPYEITKVGFKYIAEIMSNEDVIVGGEESGGLAVKGHIPERDGIWVGLMVLEFMAKTGKTLGELISEVYDIVGKFSFDRDDLHVEEALKQKIIANAKANKYKRFGKFKVESTEDLDGYKFNLGNGRWVMLRASGTEPLLRVYAQGGSAKEVRAMLDATREVLFS